MSALKLYAKPRKKRATPEADLQKAVVQFLRVAGVPGLLFFSCPNEGKRSPRLANHLKAMGMRPGAADLCIIKPRHWDREYPLVLFLELKARGGKPTKEQEVFGDAAIEADCRWEFADNIDDAIKILEQYGAIRAVPRRRADPAQRAA